MSWVRLVLAISLDGRLALPEGDTTPLGNKSDRRVLEESLAWSDGTLIGGGTLRSHKNTCLIHNNQLLKIRQSEGRSKQPIAVVVSSQKGFCADWNFFQQPIERWLLSPNEESMQCSQNFKYERQFYLQRNWSATLSQLTKAGLSRLLLLGGAHLVGSLLQADQIDELQLTLTPKIIGGKYTWMPTEMQNLSKKLLKPNAWTLKVHEELDENQLLLRYFRNRCSNINHEAS